MTIGERIKQLRKQYDLTQTELGIKIGVQQSAIRKYEHDEIKNIPYEKVKTIAQIFHTTPEYILGLNQQDENISNEIKIIDDMVSFCERLGYSCKLEISEGTITKQDEFDKEGHFIGQSEIVEDSKYIVYLKKDNITFSLSQDEFLALPSQINKLNSLFIRLNEQGKEKAIDTLSDLTAIDKYTNNGKDG